MLHLQENPLPHDPSQPWMWHMDQQIHIVGTQLGRKQQGTIRLILQNVDGIPTHEDGNIKLDCLYQLTTDYQAGIKYGMGQVAVRGKATP